MLLRKVLAEVPRLRRAGVLAAALLVSAPVAAAAPRHEAASSQNDVTIALGFVYGGVTPQFWPVVVEVNRSHRKITRMISGLRLQCTSGDSIRLSDLWTNVRIRRGGVFDSSFGPEVETNDEGATQTNEATVSGKFNGRGTKVSGTWTAKVTYADAAGAVTDVCDSGVVRWTAKN